MSSAASSPLTLHLSPSARESLQQRATAAGDDLTTFVTKIVEQAARKPFSLEELSGPAYQRFLDSGATDDQLADELEEAKHAQRAERRSRRAS